MNESYIRNVIEAGLLAAGKPLQVPELTQLFDERARPATEEVRAALAALAAEYLGRGIEIKETAAGFRIQVRREFAGEISRLWPERPAKYSRALLETLALIAYRQPITRAEIEAVRGVAVNPNILKTVIERNWVKVLGHRDVPGRPELLGTTREFLDYFGLKRLEDLPPLGELKGLDDIKLQLELPGAADGASQAAAEDAPGSGVPLAEASEAVADGAAVASAAPGLANEGAVGEGLGADAAQAAAHDGEAAANGGEDTEAERILSAAEAVEAAPENAATPPSGRDAHVTESGVSEEPGEMTGDSVGDDDAAEDEELSAEGNGSRELVAAPPKDDD